MIALSKLVPLSMGAALSLCIDGFRRGSLPLGGFHKLAKLDSA